MGDRYRGPLYPSTATVLGSAVQIGPGETSTGAHNAHFILPRQSPVQRIESSSDPNDKGSQSLRCLAFMWIAIVLLWALQDAVDFPIEGLDLSGCAPCLLRAAAHTHVI